MDRIPTDVLVACRRVVAGQPEHGRISVAVTSVARGEGRTLVSLGLARVLRREHGRPVVVLAAEPERSPAAPPAPADADQVLAGATWIEDRFGVLSVDIGPAPGGESALPELLAAVHGAGYDVVADLPPLGTAAVEESLRLFSLPVLVVRAGTTRIAEARRALSHMPTETLVVLNRTSSDIPGFLNRWLGD